MEIWPAIDLRGGKCVRLRQGDYRQETVFGEDPAAMARHWVALGAKCLHLVDLDGARDGRPANLRSVRAIVEAAIDAVVADAYGLSRDQYAHVLSTFSHASYRKAPELCLARFDELKQIGLETFTRKHDPYWDIPLNENLSQPVIDLPIPKDETAEQTEDGLWKERSGQISFVGPGPLFDQKSDKPAKRGQKKK